MNTYTLSLTIIAVTIALAAGCKKEADSGTSETDSPPAVIPETKRDERDVAISQAVGIETTSGAAEGYAKPEACVTCHADVSEQYSHHGMHKSFFKPTVAKIIEDFEGGHFYHEPSERHYKMYHEGERFFVKHYQVDGDGSRYNVHVQEITYVLGSGHHSRGYVYMTDNGEMYQMPVAWYTQELKWAMAPGFDTVSHDDFNRPITRACMFCHNAYPDVPEGSDRYGQPERFPHDLPEGIGCQRCHGPGTEHVRLANSENSTLGDIRDAIVNPDDLSKALQRDVCLQCHLQPSSKMTSVMPRMDQPMYAFRPGQPIGDAVVHFDFDTEEDDADRFEIDSSAYRLIQSTCYQSSDGEMTCTSCHDPHRKVRSEFKTEFYRDKCLQCHDVDTCTMDAKHTPTFDDVAADDCIACHMPSRRTDDVIHVVMTDHKIQRHRPQRNLLAPIMETPSPRHAVARFLLPDQAPVGPIRDVYLALPGVRDGDRSQIDRLEKAIQHAQPDTVGPYIELGAAALTNGDFTLAEKTFRKVVTMSPELALGRTNLGAALASLEQYDESIEQLRRAVELDPQHPDAYYNLGIALTRTGQTSEAIAQYETAIRLRPHYARARFNLANLLARDHAFDQAIERFEESIAIDPDLMEGYRNLGAAKHYLEDWAGAIAAWQRGLRRNPADAELAYRLAVVYLTVPDESLRNYQTGLRAALQASKLDANNGDYVLATALALYLNDQPGQALAVAKHAKSVGALPADCRLVAAMSLLERNPDEAIPLYERARAEAADMPSRSPLRRFLIDLSDKAFSKRKTPAP
jgi:tetratricopeptide (TPR) repeat protein